MSKLVVLNPFSLDRDTHSHLHGVENKLPSKTVQSDLPQSDINFIVKQFGLTHSLPYGRSVPVYADYSDAPNDYHAAMNFLRDSDQAFLTLDADIRSRFNNNPGEFLDFVSNPDNREEAASLGLVPKAPEPVNPPPEPNQPPAGDGDGGGVKA